MIIDITPGHICLGVGDKTIIIQGEAFSRGYDSPDYVVSLGSIIRWEPPFANEAIDQETKNVIIRVLSEDLTAKGIVYELE